MKKALSIWGTVGLLLIGMAACGNSPIQIKVTENGVPVSGAIVQLGQESPSGELMFSSATFTNDSGIAYLGSVSGKYSITVQYGLYEDQTMENVPSGTTVDFNSPSPFRVATFIAGKPCLDHGLQTSLAFIPQKVKIANIAHRWIEEYQGEYYLGFLGLHPGIYEQPKAVLVSLKSYGNGLFADGGDVIVRQCECNLGEAEPLWKNSRLVAWVERGSEGTFEDRFASTTWTLDN